MQEETKYGPLDKKAAVILTAVAALVNAAVVLGFVGVEEGMHAVEVVGTLLVVASTLGVGKLIEGYVYSRKTVDGIATSSEPLHAERCACSRNLDYCDYGEGCRRIAPEPSRLHRASDHKCGRPYCGCGHAQGPMGTVSHDKKGE